VSESAVDAGFSVLSFEYDPGAPARDRPAVVRDMYLAMRMAEFANNADSMKSDYRLSRQ
jgi:hypothetical protein